METQLEPREKQLVQRFLNCWKRKITFLKYLFKKVFHTLSVSPLFIIKHQLVRRKSKKKQKTKIIISLSQQRLSEYRLLTSRDLRRVTTEGWANMKIINHSRGCTSGTSWSRLSPPPWPLCSTSAESPRQTGAYHFALLRSWLALKRVRRPGPVHLQDPWAGLWFTLRQKLLEKNKKKTNPTHSYLTGPWPPSSTTSCAKKKNHGVFHRWAREEKQMNKLRLV